MINKIKIIIKKNTEIFALSILILITVVSTNYYNYNKQLIDKQMQHYYLQFLFQLRLHY